MTHEDLRAVVANRIEKQHGNKEFIRQLREGEQDDGPYMQAAFAVEEHYRHITAFDRPEEDDTP